MGVLQNCLFHLTLAILQDVPPESALLSTLDTTLSLGCFALYESARRLIQKFVAASEVPMDERAMLTGATTYWLRHTFGTQAVAREVTLDVIQAHMGDASIRISGRAPMLRRFAELEKAFSKRFWTTHGILGRLVSLPIL